MIYSVYYTWTIICKDCLSFDNIYTDKDLAEKDCAEQAKISRDMLRKNHHNMSEDEFEVYYKPFNPHYTVMTVDDAIILIRENSISDYKNQERY